MLATAFEIPILSTHIPPESTSGQGRFFSYCGFTIIAKYTDNIFSFSWNKELARKRGAAMGGEFRRKGVNILLGPVVGPAWRVVRGGRNWEGFSVDPYLSGALVAQTIEGVQSEGVQTSLKVSAGCPNCQTTLSC
jgi:hypothetical protein